MTDPTCILFLRILVLLISLPAFLISFFLISVSIREKEFSCFPPENFPILFPFFASGAAANIMILYTYMLQSQEG